MITQEKEQEILRLINLNRTTKYDVQSMLILCRELIDGRMSICSHCSAQIKFAQNQLSNWYNMYKSTQTQLDDITYTQMVEVVVEPKSKPKCSSCKKKTQSKK